MTNRKYRIDRLVPGVGRIAIASGATTKKGFDRRNAVLDTLYDMGRLDLLRAIKARTITVTEVLDAQREGTLERLVGTGRVLQRRLWEVVDQWSPKPRPGRRVQSPHTIRRYKTTFTQLRQKSDLGDTATVADLTRVDWVALEQTWENPPADWNHLRAAVSKFLSDLFGNVHHPVRHRVMEGFPKRRDVERVPDITPELFWEIVENIPEHVKACYVTIATLGLDTGEYLELTKAHLRPHIHAIEAPGTKTYVRHGTLQVDERLWPWIERGVPSPVRYGWLRKYWKRGLEAAGADTSLRLKDLRHCMGQWATDEGVSEAEVQSALRHASPNMTRRYAKQRDRGEVAKVMADELLRSA